MAHPNPKNLKPFLKKQNSRPRIFGNGPSFCPTCRNHGLVIDTRHVEGYTRRRHCCSNKTHPRWTSVEIISREHTRGRGISVQDSVRNQYKRDALKSLISELRGMLRASSQ